MKSIARDSIRLITPLHSSRYLPEHVAAVPPAFLDFGQLCRIIAVDGE